MCVATIAEGVDSSMNTMHKKIKLLLLLLYVVLLFTSCATQKPNETYTLLNDNVPQFADNEITTIAFEKYSELDDLGRCGEAFACIGEEIMPTEERGAIGQIKPSGWQMTKYDIVDGKYLYNRCHLIGYQLSGENANEKNLITGTRYMNVDGMLPFENMVADYIKETKNHVMYRVTPIFEGDNLLAKGVQMEALSVEDGGKSVSFNVFVKNVQPGVEINYLDGTSKLESENISDKTHEQEKQNAQNKDTIYILNTNTMKFHNKSCSSVKDIKPNNKEIFNGLKTRLIDNGFSPCGVCNP